MFEEFDKKIRIYFITVIKINVNAYYWDTHITGFGFPCKVVKKYIQD